MKKFILIAILLFVVSDVSAQTKRRRYRTTYNSAVDKLELIFGTGMINFTGELGGADDIGTNFLADFEFSAIRPIAHFGLRYRYNEFVASRVNLTFGWIVGDDSWTLEPARLNRNIKFESPLLEFGTVVEFYFLPDKPDRSIYRKKGLYGKGNRNGRPVLGYLSAGINGFWFDPMAKNPSGNMQSLQPLGTEGQGVVPSRDPYNRVDFSIPIGLGFIFKINKSWAIETEFGYRKTFTDYMDDVSLSYVDPALLTGPNAAYFADPSLWTTDPTNPNAIPGASSPGQQRGDPTDNDSYMFLQISASWKIGTTKRSLPKYY